MLNIIRNNIYRIVTATLIGTMFLTLLILVIFLNTKHSNDWEISKTSEQALLFIFTYKHPTEILYCKIIAFTAIFYSIFTAYHVSRQNKAAQKKRFTITAAVAVCATALMSMDLTSAAAAVIDIKPCESSLYIFSACADNFFHPVGVILFLACLLSTFLSSIYVIVFSSISSKYKLLRAVGRRRNSITLPLANQNNTAVGLDQTESLSPPS